ncbi:MAG: hypothetical protein LBF64_06015 [Oscillospiraceae bacterium]|jgi:hypothetical protein|nr:hypothetical protein [Oscillospiraceae bacterium]
MKRKPIAFLLAAALVLQFCLVGALAFDADDIEFNKAAGTVTITSGGYDPGTRLSLLASKEDVPNFTNLDYLNQLTADAKGVAELTYPVKKSVEDNIPDLQAGTYYWVTLGGVTVKKGVPLENVKVHSSARISLRIKGKAALNVSADEAAEDSYTVVSSNPAVAKVAYAEGKWSVQGVKAGTALITIRAHEDFGGAAHIVTVSVS